MDSRSTAVADRIEYEAEEPSPKIDETHLDSNLTHKKRKYEYAKKLGLKGQTEILLPQLIDHLVKEATGDCIVVTYEDGIRCLCPTLIFKCTKEDHSKSGGTEICRYFYQRLGGNRITDHDKSKGHEVRVKSVLKRPRLRTNSDNTESNNTAYYSTSWDPSMIHYNYSFPYRSIPIPHAINKEIEIPMAALGMIEKTKDLFSHYEVWHPATEDDMAIIAKNALKDPWLIGVSKNQEKNYKLLDWR